LAAIVVDVAGVEAATRRLASLQADLAFAKSRVDVTRQNLVVHSDDRGIHTVPASLDRIAARLTTVGDRLGDDERQARRFLSRALELDGRSGRIGRTPIVGAWWKRLRSATSASITSARVQLVRSSRIVWSSINRLGRAGVSLLKRSGSFVRRKADQWRHTVTTTARRIVVDGWRRLTSWANRTWKRVTGFFTQVWNAAYSKLRSLLRVLREKLPRALWLSASLAVKAITRPGKTYREVMRWRAKRRGPRQPLTPDQRTGQATVLSYVDSLVANSPPQNHIMITKSEGRYIVTLPGVEDLSDGLDLLRDKKVQEAFDVWMAAMPTGSPRDISVAWKAFLLDSNHYSLVVQAAMRRAGIPKGSEVMLIGHSHGAYTAVDLAADPTFNNHSDAPGSYRVTHVLAMGAATGVEANKIKPPTEKLIINNVFDAANTFEEMITGHRRKTPESGADEVWFIGGTEGAGHHPRNYADYLRYDATDPETRKFLEGVGKSYPAARAAPKDSKILIPQPQDAPAYDPNANTA
jgi:hypothetical protein